MNNQRDDLTTAIVRIMISWPFRILEFFFFIVWMMIVAIFDGLFD